VVAQNNSQHLTAHHMQNKGTNNLEIRGTVMQWIMNAFYKGTRAVLLCSGAATQQ